MNIRIKIYTTLVILLGFLHQSTAQAQLVNPAELELMNLQSFWRNSKNAAGLQLDQPSKYSQLSIDYETYDGDFKRPQQGSSGNRQLIETEGNLFVNQYYITGTFSYVRDNIKDAGFNASVIDPLRGMPFIIADLNPSNWNNQHYDLGFRVAGPLYRNKLSVGLSGNYKSSSAAKQRDIRAENYVYDLSIKPGLVYSPTTSHHFGFNLSYRNTKEESQMSNVNTYIDHAYFELLGLGNAVSRFGRGTLYNYEADAVGGGLQYQYSGAVQLFIEADYHVEAEDLKVTFRTPMDGASVLRKVWNAKLSLKHDGEDFSHLLGLHFYDRHMSGIQYVTQRDNSETQQGWVNLLKNVRSLYNSQRVGMQYHLIASQDKGYSWRMNTGLTYEKLKDEYILPASVKYIENMQFNLGFRKNFKLSETKNKRLLIGADLAYQTNLAGTYDYGGASPDYPTVTDLEQADFNYLTANYISATVPLTYSQQLKVESKIVLFLKANGQYAHTTNNLNYNKRYLANLSLGCNF